MSDAIRLFLRQVVEVRGLPFEVRVPTPKTVAAMNEAREIKAARFDSPKELFDAIESEAGKRKTSAAAKEVGPHKSVRKGLEKAVRVR